MPINNNHFDNFYINSVFTQNTNSGFVARCTRSFPFVVAIVSTHRINQDQPSVSALSVTIWSTMNIIIPMLWVGVLLNIPAASQPTGLNFNPCVLQSLVVSFRLHATTCHRPPCGRLWDANRVLINDNEFFIICQLLAVHMDSARDLCPTMASEREDLRGKSMCQGVKFTQFM